MSTPETSQSLLDRARDRGDAASWRKLADIYTPLIRRWVAPHVAQRADADDLVQEVLATLSAELPRFEHNQRTGAFRAWLRTVTVHRLRRYWRAHRNQFQATGGDDILEILHQLEDPDSAQSRAWEDEHDRHVAQTVLELIRLEFECPTWRAFELQVCEGRSAADAAHELGTTVNAVLIAKSRVLKRLRQKAGGLIE
jgi:RNA polymerase sigma-70 factor (ECF subfamily)